jgi:enoyl-CoA hydratase/carnithine racemase
MRLKRGGAVLMREMIAGAKPMIAAIEGNAYGAGLALSAGCDYVVASRCAKFCCAFTRVGFIPDMALMFSLPQRVGEGRDRARARRHDPGRSRSAADGLAVGGPSRRQAGFCAAAQGEVQRGLSELRCLA